MLFTTRGQVINFLVEDGREPGTVIAAVEEYCNYEPDGDQRDLIWRGSDDLDKHCIPNAQYVDVDKMTQIEFIPVIVDEAFARSIYITQDAMITERSQFGIWVDGELTNAPDGKRLSDADKLTAYSERAALALGDFLGYLEAYNTPKDEPIIDPTSSYVQDCLGGETVFIDDVLEHMRNMLSVLGRPAGK